MTFRSSASFKVLALLALSLCTILFFNLYDRYVVIGPELLKDNRFHENLRDWAHSSHGVSIITPGAGIASLHSGNPNNIVALSQQIPGIERYLLLKLACDIKTLNIPPHQGSWNTARVVLISHDHKGSPMYHLPHALANLSGTHDWKNYESVFLVDANASQVNISVQLAQTTGTMWVKNLSLLPLAEVTSFPKFRNAATLLWATVVLWVAMPILRSAFGNAHRTIIIAVAFTILLGVLMPESLKEGMGTSLFPSLSETSGASITTTFKFTPIIPVLDIYKAGHFIMFALLAVISIHGRPYAISRSKTLGYLFLFALVTEVLQLFVSARSAQMGDVFIDSMGITLGFLLLHAKWLILPPRIVK